MNLYIVFMYMSQHLSFVLLFTKFRKYFLIISLLTYVCILIFKNDTFDLNSYNKVIEEGYPFIFERAFYYIILFYENFTASSRVVLSFVQITLLIFFILLVYFLLRKESFKNYFSYFLILISSVAFNLAIYNNLRQGFASIFIIISIIYFYKNKYGFFFLFIILAQLFHESSFMFVMYLSMISLFYKSFFVFITKEVIIKKYLTIKVIILVSFLMALFSVSSLFYLLQYTSYSDYFNRFIDDRILPIYKVLPVTFLFLGSELLIGKFSKCKSVFTLVRLLRIHIFFLFLVISFFMTFAEISPRILYLYFFIEMILLIYLFKLNIIKPFIFICINYAFAINVIKILSY